MSNARSNGIPATTTKPQLSIRTARYIYVVSGTWWVSSSTHYDESKMYPIPAGSFVTDIKDTIHWDGAKPSTGPCILMLVGEGPMHTTRYVAPKPDADLNGQDFVPPPPGSEIKAIAQAKLRRLRRDRRRQY